MTDWDVLLNDLFDAPEPKLGPCKHCGGPHNDTPPSRDTVGANWKDRFVTPTWSPFVAMQRLGIKLVENDPANYMATETEAASGGPYGIWLRHDARTPVRTAAHELAHQLLKHSDLRQRFEHDTEKQDAAYIACEIEAEATAALVAYVLGNPDGSTLATSIEYLWSYADLKGAGGVPDFIRQRIKDTAGRILSAGYTAVAKAA